LRHEIDLTVSKGSKEERATGGATGHAIILERAGSEIKGTVAPW
jgi:hypothetical protein